MLVFVFKDSKNNSIEITAPSKTQAMKMLKRAHVGDTVFRYDSHREETGDEWRARMDRMERRKAEVHLKRLKGMVAGARGQPAGSAGPRKKVGANKRCPCDSGKKYKRCCGRRR